MLRRFLDIGRKQGWGAMRFGDPVFELGDAFSFATLIGKWEYQLVESRPAADPEWSHILPLVASRLDIVIYARRWTDDPDTQEIGVWVEASQAETYRRYVSRYAHLHLEATSLIRDLAMIGEGYYQLVQLARPNNYNIRAVLQVMGQASVNVFLRSSMSPETMLEDAIAIWVRPEQKKEFLMLWYQSL